MTKSELREQARMMRRQGESIAAIAASLGAARSSVSEWVRDIEITAEQLAALRARQQRNSGQARGSAENQ
jgi:transposase